MRLFPIRLKFIVILMLFAGPAIGQHTGANEPAIARTYTLQAVSGEEAQSWQEDLNMLVQELERIHPNPYHRISSEAFADAVTALDAAIPRLAAHEIIVEFARLLALVGDGHTSLPLYFAHGVDFHVLPYRLGVYDDGVFVEAADRQYAALVGGRVVAIGDVPVQEAVARVAPLISRDNDNWLSAVAPNMLNRIEILHALGIAGDLDAVPLTVQANGETRTLQITPLPAPLETDYGLPFLPEYTDTWVDARDKAEAPIPLFQRGFEDVYGWHYLPAHDVLYIKWNKVQNRDHGPTALETFREAMAFAREHHPARTIVDIRNNTGGEGGLLPPIIREIIRTREIDEPGSLFLIIGRRTFSAGQMMTAMLEQFSSAILVGEPSSAYYNGYAGHGEHAILTHSGISFSASNAYYQMGAYPHDRRQQATPQLAAVPTFADYRSNRDPALEAILDYDADAFEQDVLTALGSNNVERAEEVVRRYAAKLVNRFNPTSTQLNRLGYRLIQESRQDQALDVFELNVRVHPGYANGWDSLGEAYFRAHRRDEAISAFRKALEIQPDLKSTLEWLHRLGVKRIE